MTVELFFPGIGVHHGVDHVAIQVRRGKLLEAVDLFQRLGFADDPTRTQVYFGWGEVRFLTHYHSIPVQLTEAVEERRFARHENHVAIMVGKPETVALAVVDWANRHNIEVVTEPANGGNVFVYLYDLLHLAIELVPAL